MRRAVSFLGLFAFVLAVPGLLLVTAGPPSSPSLNVEDLRTTLSGPFLSADSVVDVLAAVGWVLWIYLLAVLVLRAVAVAAVQRKSASGKRLLRVTSRLAPSVLLTVMDLVIAALIVIGPSPAKALAKAGNVLPPPAIVMGNGSLSDGVVERSYVVRPGDSLWRIAERELGSGERWKEIFELNNGRKFSDGRALRKPDVIRPNWVLRLPPEAVERSIPEPEPPQETLDPTLAPIAPEPTATEPNNVSLSPTFTPHEAGPQENGVAPTMEPSAPSNEVRSSPPTTRSLESKPVIQVPSGAALAASFGSGILAAQALATLRRRRRFRPALDGVGSPTPEPDLIVDLRRAQITKDGKLGSATADLNALWMRRMQRLPKILAAIEDSETVTFFLEEQEEPPAKRDRYSFTRVGELLKVVVGKPFVPAVEKPSALESGALVALGEAQHSVLNLGLLAMGSVGILGSESSRQVEQMLLSFGSVLSPDQFEIYLIGDSEELGRCTELPHVESSASWADCDELLRGLQVDLMSRARGMLERSVSDVWSFGALEDAAPIPATLIVATPPPLAMRPVIEGIASQGSQLGCALLAVSWSPTNVRLCAEVDDAVSVKTTLPIGKKVLRPLLLERTRLDEARDIVQAAYPKPIEVTLDEPVSIVLDEEEVPSAVDVVQSAEREPLDDTMSEGTGESRSSIEEVIGADAVDVQCLGPLEVSRRGRSVTKGWRSGSKELLAYLIAHPKGATKGTLFGVLWPEVTDRRRADRLLRDAIYRLRMVVVDSAEKWTDSYVIRRDSWISLERSQWAVDAWHFEDLVKRKTGSPDQRYTNLREAVTLYRGEFFEGCDFSWLEAVREHYRQLFISASLSLAEVMGLSGDLDSALEAVDSALEVSPLCEELHRKAMELDAHAGRLDYAEKRYQRLVALLADELGEDPDPDTEELRRRIRTLSRK